MKRSGSLSRRRFRPARTLESLEARHLLAGDLVANCPGPEPFDWEDQIFDLVDDTIPPPHNFEANQEASPQNADEPDPQGDDPVAAPIIDESAGVPVLNSFPEADATIHLDFDGNFEPSWGGTQHVVTPPYDLDGDPETFNSQERARIDEIWQRVSEDYAPFNINVSTEDPSDATTILKQVDTTNFRVRTYYFRHEFQVTDADALLDLEISLKRDDGAAVYLNGTEIARDNLPEDADFRTFAISSTGGRDETRYFDFDFDSDLIQEGTNVVAVEVHQISDSSGDLSFDLSMQGRRNGRNTTIIQRNSTWRYLDDGTDQGTQWRDFEFNDAAWPSDQAQFGFGENETDTTLRVLRANNPRAITYYFRKEFHVEDTSAVQDLESFLQRDDGAAVYINGVEVDRDNLARNAKFDDFATSTVSGNNEDRFYRSVIDTDVLRNGRNVVAVEVHQVSQSSGDVSFDFRLVATVDNQQNQQLVQEGSDWKYLDNGSDQGTDWRAFEFDDSVWPTGTAQFGYGDAPGSVRMAIGGAFSDWYGDNAGGVAFLSSFNLSRSTVAFVFSKTLGNNAKSVAEATSHEAGHAFGLRHQSTYDNNGNKLAEYNPGSGNWGALMGVAYDRELSTWHDGTTTSDSTFQDDMARIARNSNGFGYRSDDHSSSHANATELSFDAAFEFAANGIIERNSDADAFSFTLSEGQQSIDLAVQGAEIGTNLDAVLELFDRNGNLITSDDPSDSYGASISAQLEPGAYIAVVRSNGQYGRVGQYTLTGRVDESVRLVNAFERVSPLGSLMMRATRAGQIQYANDQDQFDIQLEPGQTLNATLRPLDPTATLTAAWSGLDVEVTSESPGASLQLPTIRIADMLTSLLVSSPQTTDYVIEFGANFVRELGDTTSLDPSALLDKGTRFAVVGDTVDGATENATLISAGTEWRFLDDGSNQGTAWRTPEFDDSAWQSGDAQFGYGEDDLTTLLQKTDDSGTRVRTFYFRKTFDMDSPEAVQDLIVGLNYDDGAAVYLNGREVVRANLDSDADYRTFANVSKKPENVFDEFVIDSDSLHAGQNVLAVEIHQRSDDSSDLRFDLRLDANSLVADIDEYSFTVPEEQLGNTIDVALSGGSDFSNQSLQLIGPDGVNVLQTAVAADQSSEIDLVISGASIVEAGTYRLRFESSVQGEYGISVNQGLRFESQGNAPVLLAGGFGIGYLNQEDAADRFLIEVGNLPLVVNADFPFADAENNVSNDLDVRFRLLDQNGEFIADSADGLLQIDAAAGLYQIEIVRSTGSGEYLVTARTTQSSDDLTGDGVLSAADVDYLCQQIQDGHPEADRNQDQLVDQHDLASYLQQIGSSIGDVNLDGVFDSSDLVIVFQAGQYEDGVRDNSEWSNGDWNCDGDFETGDLVMAFQSGSYVNDAQRSIAAAVERIDDRNSEKLLANAR